MFLFLFLIFISAISQEDRGWDRDDTFCGSLNCYEIMGLSEKASSKEIKARFRELSKQYHPDKNKGDEAAADKMKEINMANDVLSSSARRKGYNNMLKMRRAMDAPRESPVVVFIGLFLLVSFIVLQYQNAQYKELKSKILKEAKVKRAFELRSKDDTSSQTGKKKDKKKKKKKKGGSSSSDSEPAKNTSRIVSAAEQAAQAQALKAAADRRKLEQDIIESHKKLPEGGAPRHLREYCDQGCREILTFSGSAIRSRRAT